MAETKMVSETDKLVGVRIRLARKAVGLTMNELAQRVGRTFQQIQKYETGVNRISGGVLFDISKVLGRTMDWFFAATATPRGVVPMENDSNDFVHCLDLLIRHRESKHLSIVQELLHLISLSEDMTVGRIEVDADILPIPRCEELKTGLP